MRLTPHSFKGLGCSDHRSFITTYQITFASRDMQRPFSVKVTSLSLTQRFHEEHKIFAYRVSTIPYECHSSGNFDRALFWVLYSTVFRYLHHLNLLILKLKCTLTSWIYAFSLLLVSNIVCALVTLLCCLVYGDLCNGMCLDEKFLTSVKVSGRQIESAVQSIFELSQQFNTFVM